MTFSKLNYLEEMDLTKHFLEQLRLKLTDKDSDVIAEGGMAYETIDPMGQSLLGSIGSFPDPTYQGPQPPNAMGLVLMVSPDENGDVYCIISGQFDIVHRSIPTLEFMRTSLLHEANSIKASQIIAIEFRRYTIEFNGVPLNFNIKDVGQWISDDAKVQNFVNEQAQKCVLDPRIFKKCNVNQNGNAIFYFDWNDALMVDQDAFNQSVRSQLFADDTLVVPYLVRLRGRLRQMPAAFKSLKKSYLLELYFENQSLPDVTRLYGIERANLLDVRFTVDLKKGDQHNVPHRLQPEDYRYISEDGLAGYGLTCGVTRLSNTQFCTNSLPTTAQPRVEAPRPEEVGMTHTPKYANLAIDPMPVLDAFLLALNDYKNTWNTQINLLDPIEHVAEIKVAIRDRDVFELEVERITDGVDLLRIHPLLQQCFRWMNMAMGRAIEMQKKSFDGWHLFQLGFILTQVRAIYERHTSLKSANDSADVADVLWFATGGGKTEAYLGIVAMTMFYSRSNERAYGTSAWMRFPLRMLSVQQFQRLSYVVAQANIIRQTEKLGGHPFTIGYFTGGGTPKHISNDNDDNLPNFLPNMSTSKLEELQFISDCPYCGTVNSINLDRDYPTARLKHICSNANCWSNTDSDFGVYGEGIRGEIGIFVSDEECYRYLPTVMVGTIDKLAVIAFNKKFAGFFGAFRHFCPEHGFIPNTKCDRLRIVENGDGKFESLPCGNNSRTSDVRVRHLSPMIDPGFSLLIQDELHLLKESLGNFDAHYETLLASIQISYGGRTPKVLAATATIKDLEDHIHNLYLKKASSFPSAGATKGESFYARRVVDPLTGTYLVRRWFAGLLPIGRGNITMRAVAEISTRFLDLVDEWRVKLSTSDATLLAAIGLKTDQAALALAYINKNLNTDLMYVNKKRSIPEVLRFLEEANGWRGVERGFKQLDGESTLDYIMGAIHHVEEKSPDDPTRHIIATAVVSHGVDIAELNFMIMAGWPGSTSEYIQASARSGRVHPGIVISVLSSRNLFETNVFLNFDDYHFFLEKLVESVPINRFAPNILDRTLPGVLSSILINLAPYAAPWGTSLDWNVKSIHKVLNTAGSSARVDLEKWAMNALSIPPSMTSTFDARILEDFQDALRGRVQNALHRLEHWTAGKMDVSIVEALGDIFGHGPMRSFRDIENQISIKTISEQAEQIIDALAR
jgi:hypothetical protein